MLSCFTLNKDTNQYELKLKNTYKVCMIGSIIQDIEYVTDSKGQQYTVTKQPKTKQPAPDPNSTNAYDNIDHIFEYVEHDDSYYTITQYFDKGTLNLNLDIIKSESDALQCFRHIVNGTTNIYKTSSMQALTMSNVVVKLNPTNTFYFALTDLIMPATNPNNIKNIIYSLGMILFGLLINRDMQLKDSEEIKDKIQNAPEVNMAEYIKQSLSKCTLSILDGCLCAKEELRITLDELCMCLMIKELYTSKPILNIEQCEIPIAKAKEVMKFKYEPLMRDENTSKFVLTLDDRNYYIKAEDINTSKSYAHGIHNINNKFYLPDDVQNSRYIVKIVPKQKTDTVTSKEIECYKHMLDVFNDGDHVVTLFDCIESTEKYYIVMPFYDQGSLKEFCSKKLIKNDSDAIECIRQIAIGVQKLHDNNIIHGNLNMDNVLVKSKPDEQMKSEYYFAIKDYGVEPQSYNKSTSAPEKELGFKADVYSLGHILYKLLTNEDATEPSNLSKVSNPLLKKIVSSCLDKDPLTRCSLKVICNIGESKEIIQTQNETVKEDVKSYEEIKHDPPTTSYKDSGNEVIDQANSPNKDDKDVKKEDIKSNHQDATKDGIAINQKRVVCN